MRARECGVVFFLSLHQTYCRPWRCKISSYLWSAKHDELWHETSWSSSAVTTRARRSAPLTECSIEALWWSGEKLLSDNVSYDKNFFQRLKESLEEAIASDECTGVLIDSSIPIEERTIIFYLDLWHGRSFPYDDFDIINQYLPTPWSPLGQPLSRLAVRWLSLSC